MWKILDWITPKNRYEKRSAYVEKYGMPDDTKVFLDGSGNILFLLGKKNMPDWFAKAYEKKVRRGH